MISSDPLSPWAKSLVDEERARAAGPTAQQASALWSRLQTSVPAAPRIPAPGPAPVSAARRLPLSLATFLTGVAVGVGGTYALLTRAPEPKAAQPTASAPVPPLLPAQGSPPALPLREPASARVEAAAPKLSPARIAAPVRPAGEPEGSLVREQAWVDTARAALARNRPDDALEALRRHAQTFPSGTLAEERDALWVQALIGAGHPAQALEKAALFRSLYPDSMFLPVVDAATTSLSP